MTSRNYTALIRPVTSEEVASFKRNNMVSGVTAQRVLQVVTMVIGAIIGVIFLVLFVSVIAATGFGPLQVLLTAGVIAVAALGVYTIIRAQRGVWRARLRKAEFAAANGFGYREMGDDPKYPGLIFNRGDSRRRTEMFASTSGRRVEVANYRYTTGDDKNRTTHTWGYVVIGLDRNLPHMVLDAKGNNALFGSNLPQYFDSAQRLSLEGDFDKYFTLYCPREYERDALYVLTPDLMALLIDNAAPFDIEIIDNELYVYAPVEFTLTDPHVWLRLFQIIDVVGAKAVSQTDRYADERIGDPAIDYVAPSGQRLRSSIPLGAKIGFVAVLAAMAAFYFGSFVSLG